MKTTAATDRTHEACNPWGWIADAPDYADRDDANRTTNLTIPTLLIAALLGAGVWSLIVWTIATVLGAMS